MPPKQQDDVDALNAAVDRMRKFIEEQPYIQSIPQDEPRWHHRNWEHANAWRREAPFDTDERADLQYQTFYYHEHGANLIHLGVHTPITNLNDSISSSDAPKSLTATPKLGPKKKISLADYKNQKVNTPRSVPEPKQRMPNGIHQSGKQEEKKSGNAKQTLPSSSTRDFAKPDNPQVKRKRSPERSAPEESPEPVRRRLDDKQATSRKPSQADRTRREQSPSADRKRKRDDDKKIDGFELPAPISPIRPLMPERLSPIGFVLPDRLSPTLPAKIVDELDRREERRRAQSDASKSSNASSKAESKHDSVRSHADGSRDEIKKRKRTPDVEDRSINEKAPENAHEGHSQSQDQPHEPSAATLATNKDAERPSLIFKIKVPKSRRQDYSRLLRFPPRPAKWRSDDVEDRARKTVPTTDANEQQEQQTVSQREPHDSSESKRRKPSRSPSPARKAKSFTDTQKTTLQAPFQSPPPPAKETKPHATPSSKRPVSHAMARVPSTDSHIPSPLAPTPNSNHSQPTTTSHLKPSPSSSTSSRHTPLSQSWQTESDRLLTLAKSLKKTSQTLLASSNPADKERGVLTSIESFCGFMLHFHATDRMFHTMKPPRPAGSNAPRTWGTMNALWRFYWDHAGQWPALRGVIGALGMVFLGRVFAWCEAGRGTEGTEKEKMVGDAVRNLGLIATGKGLESREVRERWPGLWGKVLAGGKGKEEEAGPVEYEGECEWPLTVQTGVVRAVRTALEMCREWRVEGKRFETTLKLKA